MLQILSVRKYQKCHRLQIHLRVNPSRSFQIVTFVIAMSIALVFIVFIDYANHLAKTKIIQSLCIVIEITILTFFCEGNKLFTSKQR